MATSTLRLLPTANDVAQLDPASLASVPGVAYDLKRLKVYSSCLRCRAKKVKCDRKEPCSRCEKHSVECSYRELASVQLDIRQFQRHLNNPKIRKDGAGFITSTATPVITSASSPSSTPTPALSATSPSVSSAHSNWSNSDFGSVSPSLSSSPSARNQYNCPHPSICGSGGNETTSENNGSLERAQVYKVHRRKPSFKPTKGIIHEGSSEIDRTHTEMREISEHVDRVKLLDSNNDSAVVDDTMSSDMEEDNANLPIWHTQAMGKHKQTVHEQNMAETFGLAAYLKAKEMEISQDPGRAGQTIDYEMELERALAQRMPSSFSRPDRSYSRSLKHAHLGYNPATPYARPSHCQLSPPPNSSSKYAQPPPSAQCCCQIAALQGQALGSCPYSNVSHSGYEKPSTTTISAPTSSSLPPSWNVAVDNEEAPRIAYSPSYSPRYSAAPVTCQTPPQVQTSDWQPSSTVPPTRTSRSSSYSSSMKMDISSPCTELPPIRLPGPSELQVGRDENEPVQIECKYNEPNVDAWDMIEKPISRKVPLTTKRGRSIKMEMGWILS
ncbi:hypothetical protein BC939DRAFT_271427 [Gamsiella multidivaricata]|uniref:uncharacterized protein n=1 Tax=Gamsiella multidivaricata TaxID=101098 RepID=UPI00221F700F|nr:uncharacterized protein BC939DRAFT_271427 [Gamsiella multidivaricata]KAI7819068.1 hypothetical protein BC939DRAFT_271427 [Gamsiella multidivaricata]